MKYAVTLYPKRDVGGLSGCLFYGRTYDSDVDAIDALSEDLQRSAERGWPVVPVLMVIEGGKIRQATEIKMKRESNPGSQAEEFLALASHREVCEALLTIEPRAFRTSYLDSEPEAREALAGILLDREANPKKTDERTRAAQRLAACLAEARKTGLIRKDAMKALGDAYPKVARDAKAAEEAKVRREVLKESVKTLVAKEGISGARETLEQQKEKATAPEAGKDIRFQETVLRRIEEACPPLVEGGSKELQERLRAAEERAEKAEKRLAECDETLKTTPKTPERERDEAVDKHAAQARARAQLQSDAFVDGGETARKGGKRSVPSRYGTVGAKWLEGYDEQKKASATPAADPRRERASKRLYTDGRWAQQNESKNGLELAAALTAIKALKPLTLEETHAEFTRGWNAGLAHDAAENKWAETKQGGASKVAPVVAPVVAPAPSSEYAYLHGREQARLGTFKGASTFQALQAREIKALATPEGLNAKISEMRADFQAGGKGPEYLDAWEKAFREKAQEYFAKREAESVIRWTDAPASYDHAVSTLQTGEFGPWRRVQIRQDGLDSQRQRYASGTHWLLTDAGFTEVSARLEAERLEAERKAALERERREEEKLREDSSEGLKWGRIEAGNVGIGDDPKAVLAEKLSGFYSDRSTEFARGFKESYLEVIKAEDARRAQDAEDRAVWAARLAEAAETARRNEEARAAVIREAEALRVAEQARRLEERRASERAEEARIAESQRATEAARKAAYERKERLNEDVRDREAKLEGLRQKERRILAEREEVYDAGYAQGSRGTLGQSVPTLPPGDEDGELAYWKVYDAHNAWREGYVKGWEDYGEKRARTSKGTDWVLAVSADRSSDVYNAGFAAAMEFRSNVIPKTVGEFNAQSWLDGYALGVEQRGAAPTVSQIELLGDAEVVDLKAAEEERKAAATRRQDEKDFEAGHVAGAEVVPSIHRLGVDLETGLAEGLSDYENDAPEAFRRGFTEAFTKGFLDATRRSAEARAAIIREGQAETERRLAEAARLEAERKVAEAQAKEDFDDGKHVGARMARANGTGGDLEAAVARELRDVPEDQSEAFRRGFEAGFREQIAEHKAASVEAWTNAPESYDREGGTYTLGRDGDWRRIQILRSDVDWQKNRNMSGLYQFYATSDPKDMENYTYQRQREQEKQAARSEASRLEAERKAAETRAATVAPAGGAAGLSVQDLIAMVRAGVSSTLSGFKP